jgi:hypothetical protein
MGQRLLWQESYVHSTCLFVATKSSPSFKRTAGVVRVLRVKENGGLYPRKSQNISVLHT